MSKTDVILENSRKIKSIPEFAEHLIIDGSNIFVCIVGENDTYLSDISDMDSKLRTAYAYTRLSSLPPMPPEKVTFYEDKYNSWLRSFKQKAFTKTTLYKEKQAELLSNALVQTINIFRHSRKQVTDSIEKNFVIKLLFWYDYIAEDVYFDSHIDNGIKIVAENILKIHEYLFFYMFALMGADVMLLQNKVDFELPIINLNISARSVLGHLGSSSIPKFMKIRTQPVTNGRYIPPFQNSPGANNGNMSGNVSTGRAAAPSRFNTPNPYMPSSTGGAGSSPGSVRVTIPPRPDRQRRSNAAPAAPRNDRAAAPLRQNTSSTFTSSDTGSSPGNIRVTIPPRPDRQRRPSSPTAAPANIRPINPQPQNRQPVRIQTSTQSSRGTGSFYTPELQRNTPFRQNEKSYEEIAQLASSVVQIFAIRQNPRNSDKFQILGSGSGIMISSYGHILTNHHVARASNKYIVRIENDEEIYYTDRLIKYHSDFDLAVIQIERKLTPLPIYKSQKPLVRGQKVVAIGSPIGLFNTVSDGIISGFRTINGIDMIQFTAPISSGSSGGALLNMYGELIGISTSGIDEGQNINFAVGYEIILNFTRGISSMF